MKKLLVRKNYKLITIANTYHISFSFENHRYDKSSQNNCYLVKIISRILKHGINYWYFLYGKKEQCQ